MLHIATKAETECLAKISQKPLRFLKDIGTISRVMLILDLWHIGVRLIGIPSPFTGSCEPSDKKLGRMSGCLEIGYEPR